MVDFFKTSKKPSAYDPDFSAGVTLPYVQRIALTGGVNHCIFDRFPKSVLIHNSGTQFVDVSPTNTFAQNIYFRLGPGESFQVPWTIKKLLFDTDAACTIQVAADLSPIPTGSFSYEVTGSSDNAEYRGHYVSGTIT